MRRSRLKRGPSRIWSNLHRLGLVRAHLPFWRVVVEARLNPSARAWPADLSSAVAGVFVWARTIEEAEGLAALALEDEGMETQTADAVRWPPAAKPSRVCEAVSRTAFGYLKRADKEVHGFAFRRGAPH